MTTDVTKAERELGHTLLPQYDANGLIPAIVLEQGSNEPLMFAYMNARALELTIQTKEAHFYSRSRSEIWHKGGTSGNVLKIEEILVDCDQDVLLLRVRAKGHGAACHTGRKSCFYRRITIDEGNAGLEMMDGPVLFDPKDVYKK